MDREIKLRAWYKPESKMYYWGSGIIAIDHHLNIETVPSGRILKAADIELMQSTGIEDCDGCTIFEGDIVCRVPCSDSLVRGIVTWMNEMPGFIVLASKATEAYVVRQPWEVLGNIYEHPDLMEAQA